LWILVPVRRREQFVLCLVQAWRAQQAFELGRVKRFRLPAVGWRYMTIVVIVALLSTDPKSAYIWNAHAQCPMPLNASTETTRITELAYDLDGRLAQVNSPEGVINYSYDLATGRHSSTCTTNSQIAFGYDELGRLKTVTVLKRNGTTLGAPETTTYTYTKVGTRDTMTLPNGTVTSYQYDSLNRLTNLVQQAGTTNLARYAYQLSPAGKRTNAIEILRQEDGTYLTNTLRWQYDGMYRLTNEVSVSSYVLGTYTNLYSYDKAGNRLKKTRTGTAAEMIDYSYNANDQLLQEDSTVNNTTTYLYNGNGSVTNRTSGGTVLSYTYNLANKLSSVAANGSPLASYQYNEQGMRVRVTMGTTKYYLIDPNNHTGYSQILEELNTVGGTPTMSYVLGDDVVAQASASSVSYLLYDGHGSTRQLANNTSGITSRYNYDAYGIMQPTSSPSAQTSLLYCGEQYDSTLNMYNFRARYYDPGTGRFNGMDSFMGDNDDPQSLHKYAYAHCDPVNNIDPTGEFSAVQILVVSAIVGVIAGIITYAITGSIKTAIIVGILAALLTAAIMLLITFWPVIVRAVGTWWRQQLADRTVTNGLYNKLLQEFGPNPTQAQKLLFFSRYSSIRLFFEGIGGYLQKILELFIKPAGFLKWFRPTWFDGLGCLGVIALVGLLIYVFRDNIADLFRILRGR
jgi:RHS repeat-associated protein